MTVIASEPPQARTYPPSPRLLLAIVGAVLFLYFLLDALGVASEGRRATAVALVLVTVPLAALFLLVAVVPARVEHTMKRISPQLDLADGGHLFAFALLAVALYIVLGLGTIAQTVDLYERGGAAAAGADSYTSESILSGILANVVILVVPPLVWVTFVNGVRLSDAWTALGVRDARLARDAMVGVALAVGAILALGLLSTAIQLATGTQLPVNDRALAIAKAVSLPAAIALALGSAFSEELFFRGFLLPRIGLVAQAVLFSAAHLSYFNALEIVATLALGVAFALATRRTGSIVAALAAHFSFNLIMVLAAQYLGG